MKKNVLIIILAMLPLTSFCQVLVNHSSRQIERLFKRGFKGNKVIVTKTDTNLIYLLRDSTVRALDFYCSFDKSRNCTFQKVSFDCDSCYHKFLKFILAEKKFEWLNVSPERYLSKYPEHVLLVANEKKLYYTITLVNYSKDEYKRVVNASRPEAYY